MFIVEQQELFESGLKPCMLPKTQICYEYLLKSKNINTGIYV